MVAGPSEPIALHAQPAVHEVALGAPDAPAVRAATTAAVAELVGGPPALVLTGSCSAALDAAASGVGTAPGDEVLVPAFTFPTSISPFLLRGATVRFVDVDPSTGNVDLADLEAKLTDRTRAVVAMHYGGVAAIDDADVARWAARGIDVVEDAAHGLHATVHGVPLGRLGRFGCLSFHRTKNLSSLEGGALLVNRAEDLDAVLVALDKGTDRVAFEEGRRPSYEWQGLGSAGRMGEGAVRYLAAELAGVDRVQARRAEVRDAYQEQLAPWAAEVGVGLPIVAEGRTDPAHLFFLLLPAPDDRPGFVAHLGAAGVSAARHYSSMPDTPFGRTVRLPGDECPAAAHLAGRLVRIPLHHELDDAAVARIVAAVTSWRPTAA